MTKTHDIKCLPAQFAALETQDKTFEFRKNDRNYQVGDTLIIREWLLSEQRYTGKHVTRVICHMLTEGFGLPNGYAVLGLCGTLKNALAMTGCESEDDLIDMANVGRSLMSKIDLYVEEPSLLEGWAPAEDPAEIVGDLYNRLEESLACHRQAMDEGKRLATGILELADAVDAAADDIGTGSRTALVILRELVQLAERYDAGKSVAPDGFSWLDRPITVTGGDYRYDGQLLCSFPKEPGGKVRYIVRDGNNRLFIHNAQQCGLESA